MFGKRKRQIKQFIDEKRIESHGEYADDIYKVVSVPYGNKTPDSYYICAHCGWEYDSTKECMYSSANHVTLGKYRKIYKNHKENK